MDVFDDVFYIDLIFYVCVIVIYMLVICLVVLGCVCLCVLVVILVNCVCVRDVSVFVSDVGFSFCCGINSVVLCLERKCVLVVW